MRIPMHRQAVNSSNIRSIGYETTTQTLEIEFHGGRIYQYSGVGYAVYQGLMSATSKGSYFHSHIKDKYPFTRIE